ncbi:MAG TPA: BBP7 family outer membrane beta-barrel protein [Gemmataceae bacterium]|nr:BBP7 family outer membrane beta-barrel protein [Gemmataceae bacterium]
MTRTSPIAVLAVLILGGAAFGQPAPSSPADVTFPACAADCGAADGGRVWADAEFLLGWVQGDPLPPLVASSPAGTARASAGVLGTPGVVTLFGGATADNSTRQGARFDVGYWFDANRQFGIEAGMFALESDTEAFGASSNGAPILARPYMDVTTGNAASALVAFPGVSTGSVGVADSGRNFVGVNADLAGNCIDMPDCRIDALIGYQGLRYDERLGVTQTIVPTSGPFVAGTTILSSDAFATKNIFNGLDLGFRSQFRYDAFSMDLLTKVAAGPLQRNVTILGSQTVTVPGAAPVVSTGGLLALSSNIGSFTTHALTAAPEVGVKFGYDVSPHVRVYGGYDILWWLNVVRTGEQVDVGVNPGLIPPATAGAGSPSRPAFTGVTSSIWAQTLSLGLEVKY